MYYIYLYKYAHGKNLLEFLLHVLITEPLRFVTSLFFFSIWLTLFYVKEDMVKGS